MTVNFRAVIDVRTTLRPQNPPSFPVRHSAATGRISGTVWQAILRMRTDALQAEYRELRRQSPPRAESAMPGLSSRHQARNYGAENPLPFGSTGRRRSQPSLMPFSILYQMR